MLESPGAGARPLAQAGPEAHYAAATRRNGFVDDPAQRRAVAALQRVYDALMAERPSPLGRIVEKLAPRSRRPVTGLYLWGAVGRGKTYLVDCFYDSLPGHIGKQRVHFHRFMQRVHDELRGLDAVRDPLPHVAARMAGDSRVLCFDEFHVGDIADAMLLAGLLEALFERGVTLVATSNTPPRELYKDGLQRAKFLPAIDLIERHTQVLELAGATDYRLRVLERAEIYHCPLDETADTGLARSFNEIATEPGEHDTTLAINGRDIPVRCVTDGVVWLDFDAACRGPRSAGDYIELARCFHTVLISNMPQLDDTANDPARRFITLVDELYDRQVKLIASAEVPVEKLYVGERLAADFERTRSRLIEMQSHDYLARPHLP